MGGVFGASPTPEQVAAAAAQVVIPYASSMPKGEGSAAAPGSADTVPRGDHVHPRLTATGPNAPEALVLDANGLATVTFTQAFDNQPAVTVISVGARAAGKSIPDFDITYIQGAAGTPNAGKYTGCTVYGRRARALPAQTQVNALAILTGVITGVNNLATSLGGYDTTEPAAGAGFSLIAVKTSYVPPAP